MGGVSGTGGVLAAAVVAAAAAVVVWKWMASLQWSLRCQSLCPTRSCHSPHQTGHPDPFEVHSLKNSHTLCCFNCSLFRVLIRIFFGIPIEVLVVKYRLTVMHYIIKYFLILRNTLMDQNRDETSIHHLEITVLKKYNAFQH